MPRLFLRREADVPAFVPVLSRLQVLDGLQKFFERAPEPIQAGDGQAVAGAGVIYQGRQTGVVELFV